MRNPDVERRYLRYAAKAAAVRHIRSADADANAAAIAYVSREHFLLMGIQGIICCYRYNIVNDLLRSAPICKKSGRCRPQNDWAPRPNTDFAKLPFADVIQNPIGVRAEQSAQHTIIYGTHPVLTQKKRSGCSS